ncbi:hypothetical protein [Williamsia sp. 1135]|uniref:hypothetical protein n=1 Tax=Williamsia sp. 1135 TaxID=1889262 RepID=UPI00143AC740|nr:hypothetical protein [Williamsia sp. 1135]
MTDEVKFTNEQWDALAEAAEVFAETLVTEREKLSNVLLKNWAGECEEGRGTINNLRFLLNGLGQDSFAGAIESESAYLRGIANTCRSAKNNLSGVDLGNAGDLGNAS